MKTIEFSTVLSNAVVKNVRGKINTIQFISLKPIFEHSKSESQCGISVKRIGDNLPYGFPQTDTLVSLKLDDICWWLLLIFRMHFLNAWKWLARTQTPVIHFALLLSLV